MFKDKITIISGIEECTLVVTSVSKIIKIKSSLIRICLSYCLRMNNWQGLLGHTQVPTHTRARTHTPHMHTHTHTHTQRERQIHRYTLSHDMMGPLIELSRGYQIIYRTNNQLYH